MLAVDILRGNLGRAIKSAYLSAAGCDYLVAERADHLFLFLGLWKGLSMNLEG
jgi:hypothetical protein